MTPIAILKPGREKSVLRHHPWVFAGGLKTLEGQPQPGEPVLVRTAAGAGMGWAAYSPQSQIALRFWTFNAELPVTRALLQERLQNALVARQALQQTPQLTAYRLVNAESDGLPGLIVDRYGDFLVCQFLAAGAEFYKATVVELLAALQPCRGIYERSNVEIRKKEGLPLQAGGLWGELPPEQLVIEELGAKYVVDIYRGHKTGFYLDQRDNRYLMQRYAAEREVLNCFAYTGGFTVRALQGGAQRVVNIDTSGSALGWIAEAVSLNGLSSAALENVEGDVFRVLRQYRDNGQFFDVVVLDPPKFADSVGQLDRATRGYKDINLLAFKILRPGGHLFTFSCSGAISPDLFQKIVAGAALDSGREARIIHRLTQGVDHPVALNFPESEYLKGLVCQVF